MSLGLESGTVRVVPYDPRWAQLFTVEAERLSRALAAVGISLTLEHVGSTAVPGLPAKPVLDLLGGYPPGDAPLAPYIHILEAAGYTHRGEQGIPGREFFRRGEPRAYHLHLAVTGGAFWRDQLAFRDRLRASPTLRDAYAALKRDLATRHPRDREAYTAGKGPFVRQVLAQPPSDAREAAGEPT
jgi:GrpB-like predicted nucleotidyltransferase (UPF0157 family)